MSGRLRGKTYSEVPRQLFHPKRSVSKGFSWRLHDIDSNDFWPTNTRNYGEARRGSLDCLHVRIPPEVPWSGQ